MRFAVCCLVLLVVPVLEAVWERVGVRVVDQGVVAVTPGELLGPRIIPTCITCPVSRVTCHACHAPDAEVVVLHEGRGVHLIGVGEDEGGDVGQRDGGARHHEEGSPPSAQNNCHIELESKLF